MFEKFITDKYCMRVLSWFLTHQDGEYSASIIGIECKLTDMTSYMAVITILEGVGLISINEREEDLIIRFNKDSSISQLLTHFRDEFNDLAFKTEQVAPALSYLDSEVIKKLVDKELFEEFDDKILDMIKDYENLNLDNNMEREVYDLCLKLKETGEYEKFIEFLEEK